MPFTAKQSWCCWRSRPRPAARSLKRVNRRKLMTELCQRSVVRRVSRSVGTRTISSTNRTLKVRLGPEPPASTAHMTTSAHRSRLRDVRHQVSLPTPLSPLVVPRPMLSVGVCWPSPGRSSRHLLAASVFRPGRSSRRPSASPGCRCRGSTGTQNARGEMLALCVRSGHSGRRRRRNRPSVRHGPAQVPSRSGLIHLWCGWSSDGRCTRNRDRETEEMVWQRTRSSRIAPRAQSSSGSPFSPRRKTAALRRSRLGGGSLRHGRDRHARRGLRRAQPGFTFRCVSTHSSVPQDQIATDTGRRTPWGAHGRRVRRIG